MHADDITLKGPELDPQGKSAQDAGAKLDAGKPRISMVLGGFPRALMEVAKVGTFGANKYSDNGWMTVPNGIQRFEDALWRHDACEHIGEYIDLESGLLHAAHRAWNALAALELKLREQEKVTISGSIESSTLFTPESPGLLKKANNEFKQDSSI